VVGHPYLTILPEEAGSVRREIVFKNDDTGSIEEANHTTAEIPLVLWHMLIIAQGSLQLELTIFITWKSTKKTSPQDLVRL
jgi:hypothetical protein